MVEIEVNDEMILSEEQILQYQRLNLTNDFMFRHCLNDEQLLKPILEELWGREIGELVEIHQDYHIQPTGEHRSIFCDIYVRDSNNDIFILEMQKKEQKELRKRSKCYQVISMFDHCTLKEKEKEKIEYSIVPECYIAFLCCFDVSKVFRKNNVRVNEEVTNTIYSSESMLFIDLRKYEYIGHERLRELFKFILISDVHLHVSWSVVQLLQEKVREKRRDRNMTFTYYISEGRLNERYDQGVEKGKKEGISIGEERQKREIVIHMYKENMNINDIARFTGVSIDRVEEIISESQKG